MFTGFFAVWFSGRLFQAASNVIFILMLILMAKGYSITRGRLPQISTVRITIFFVLFVVVYITLFIWEGLVSRLAELCFVHDIDKLLCIVLFLSLIHISEPTRRA